MRKLVLAAALVLVAGGAQAATLNVIGGQLIGASGVLVDGSLYDVEFFDGSCTSLYNGCDDVSDFTFQTGASATLAAQALLDQVFLDSPQGFFDQVPALTRGCDGGSQCNVLVPYKVSTNGFCCLGPGQPYFLTDVRNMAAVNNGLPQLNTIGSVTLGYSFDSISSPSYCFPETACGPGPGLYSVWSPIPEPSTALLLGLGLAGIAARRRA